MTFIYPDVAAHARDEGALLRDAGRYVDDVRIDNEAHGFVLRSPHAHARIQNIDATRAKTAPGVLAVFTAADLTKQVRLLGCVMPLVSRDGRLRVEADRPVLASDKVCHAGEGVAYVVVETLEGAMDAATVVSVRYEALPVVATPGSSPVPIWDQAPHNVCSNWQFGDDETCRRLFEVASHVSCIALTLPRIAAIPIEPRAALTIHDPAGDEFTLLTTTQGVHFGRCVLAQAFGYPPQKLRVMTPHVGGGFRSKIFAYPEHALVLAAARQTGRPVRWTATRRVPVRHPGPRSPHRDRTRSRCQRTLPCYSR